MWRFTVFLPPGATCKGVCFTYLRGRWPCPLLTWPTLETIRGTGCWAVRLQVWHPWLVLETSLIVRRDITWARCVFTFTVPDEFINSTWGQEPVFPRNTTRDCWETNIQSEQEVMQWNATLFQLQYGLVLYRPNYNPVLLGRRGLSVSWGSHDLTLQPVITCVYLCGRIYASCPLHYSPFILE
jgi:hypothetical protein